MRIVHLAYMCLVLSVLMAVPKGYAKEFNSLAEAKENYNPVGCRTEYNEGVEKIKDCIAEGKSLQRCGKLVDPNILTHSYVFTRHATTSQELDPVSITTLHNNKICFLTALSPEAPVTKTCFKNLDDPKDRSVEAIEGMELSRGHEHLEAGQSVQHFELRFPLMGACGHFENLKVTFDHTAKPICLLTALEPGEDVTQVCFDPQNPESLSLKKVDGIALQFQDNGKPVSIVVEDPNLLNLNVVPAGTTPCPNQKGGISLFDALAIWWTQRDPCSKKNPEKITQE